MKPNEPYKMFMRRWESLGFDRVVNAQILHDIRKTVDRDKARFSNHKK